MIRVLVVDDHPVVRDGVRAALAGSDLELVGEAAAGTDGVALAAQLHPDVVVMDLGLPDISGIEATRQILAARPGTAVLAFTMSEDSDSVFAALRAGAMGYLVKGVDRNELLLAIRAVAGGEALLLGPGIARRALAHFTASAPTAGLPEGSGGAAHPELAELSPREREVLDLMAAGLGNQAIAARLYLAPKTVRNHVSNIIGKLQADDRGAAIVRARRMGLGSLD